MLKRIFKNGSFSANVATLVTGTIIAQSLPLAVSPILTRIFSPENFGLFGLYFSVVTIISVPISGRYEFAIILPEKDEDAINVMSLSIVLTFLSSVLLFIISFLLHDQILQSFENKNIGTLIYLLAISTFLVGSYQSLNYWFNRKAKYKELAISRIARSGNTSIVSIILGFLNVKNGGLILGDIVGQATATFFLVLRFLKNHKGLLREITFEKMKLMAKRYSQFPKFNVFSGLLERGSGQLPVLLLTSFFGLTTVGFFSLSQRVISAPGAIIARAFGDVFRQRASEEFVEKGECRHLFMTMLKKLFLLAIAPFLILFFCAPWAFEFIFGSEWIIAGEYTQILTLMFFLQFIVSPLSVMFLVAEKQKIDLILQIFLFCSLFISFFVGFKLFDNVKICLWFFTVTYSVKYLIELYLSYRFSLGKKY